MSDFQNFENFENFKNIHFLFFSNIFPSKSKFSTTKNVKYVRGQCQINMWHVYTISSLYLQKWLRYDIKHVKNRRVSPFSRLYRDFPNFVFWPTLTFQKVLQGHFSRSLRKFDLKTCIAALNSDFFLFDLFYLVTWDDLDLYCGHRAQDDAYRCQWHYPCRFIGFFALNIETLLADVTKPKKSKKNIWPYLWRDQWPPG